MLPQLFSGKESACQCRRHGFNPWIGKIPWRRKWHPTPVLLPGESHGGRSLVGYSPWGHKESDTTERLHIPCFYKYALMSITFKIRKAKNDFNIFFFLILLSQSSCASPYWLQVPRVFPRIGLWDMQSVQSLSVPHLERLCMQFRTLLSLFLNSQHFFNRSPIFSFSTKPY